MQQKILQRKTVAAYIIMIVLVYMSNTGYFGGRTIEQASNIPGEILVPAGFTFSIRGLIYIGMAVFSIYQLRKSTLHDKTISAIRPWVIANFLANGLRLPAATMLEWSRITVVLILFMGYSLWIINNKLIHYASSTATKRYIILPMSIYFGRITIASSLNIASVISGFGFSEVVQQIPRVIGWISLAGVAIIMIFQKFRYLSYISVFLRALLGVIIERQSDAPVVSWIGILLFLGTFVYIIYRSAQKKLILQ